MGNWRHRALGMERSHPCSGGHNGKRSTPLSRGCWHRCRGSRLSRWCWRWKASLPRPCGPCRPLLVKGHGTMHGCCTSIGRKWRRSWGPMRGAGWSTAAIFPSKASTRWGAVSGLWRAGPAGPLPGRGVCGVCQSPGLHRAGSPVVYPRGMAHRRRLGGPAPAVWHSRRDDVHNEARVGPGDARRRGEDAAPAVSLGRGRRGVWRHPGLAGGRGGACGIWPKSPSPRGCGPSVWPRTSPRGGGAAVVRSGSAGWRGPQRHGPCRRSLWRGQPRRGHASRSRKGARGPWWRRVPPCGW
jgi:hypothetical protein